MSWEAAGPSRFCGGRPAVEFEPFRQARHTSGVPKERFSAEERAAMRERAKELKAAKAGADAEADVLAKIREMPEADRTIAEKLHEIVRTTAPDLQPRTWYGMPAYARDDKIVCFFQGSAKFKTRYATFGFSDRAKLDDGDLWPTSYAIPRMTPAVEQRIAELVRTAAG
jgi:uncharacterized protein YdhG (YjbR/CyaY superfamily)